MRRHLLKRKKKRKLNKETSDADATHDLNVGRMLVLEWPPRQFAGGQTDPREGVGQGQRLCGWMLFHPHEYTIKKKKKKKACNSMAVHKLKM